MDILCYSLAASYWSMSLLQLSSSSRRRYCFDFTPFFKSTKTICFPTSRQADAGIPIALQSVSNKSTSVVASRHLGETRASNLNVLWGVGARGPGPGSARVNQHPPMHQLAVLSMGWAAFSIQPQSVNSFLFLTNEYFWCCVFFSTMIFILPSHLVILPI
jgi:hypothetical protein